MGSGKKVLIGMSLLALTFVISLAPSAQADTIYTYTGNAYTSGTGGPITASFGLASPLAANLNDFTITPTFWTISDGTLTLNNTDATLDSSYFSTTASGAITTAWAFVAESNTAPGTGLGTFNDPAVVTADFRIVGDNLVAANTNSSGIWSTPEPSSLLLLCIGLLGLALFVRRDSQGKRSRIATTA